MAQWFGPRSTGLGFGVAPRSWQGWLATAILVAAILGSKFVRWESFGLPHWSRTVFIPMVMLGYLGLAAATYEDD